MLSFLCRHAIKECGTQMLEMDVRRTKDGVVVVSHDMHLGRLCGADVRVDQGGNGRMRISILIGGIQGVPVTTGWRRCLERMSLIRNPRTV